MKRPWKGEQLGRCESESRIEVDVHLNYGQTTILLYQRAKDHVRTSSPRSITLTKATNKRHHCFETLLFRRTAMKGFLSNNLHSTPHAGDNLQGLH